MNSKRIKDERVTLAKRKIQSDGFWLVWIILLASTLVQQWLKAPVSQYVVEVIIWLSMSVYVLIFNIAKGHDEYPSSGKNSNRLIIVQSFFTGLVVATINTVQNYFEYGERIQESIILNTVSVAAVSFISASFVAFAVLKLLAYLNAKRQKKINDMLDNNE